jgi:hypothetical protein
MSLARVCCLAAVLAGLVLPAAAGGAARLDHEFVAADGTAGAGFGSAVAINADGSEAAVGAPGGAGRVYAYASTYSADGSFTWRGDGEISMPGQQHFGGVLAMSADGETLAVGADGPRIDVYTGSSLGWGTREPYVITPPFAHEVDQLAVSEQNPVLVATERQGNGHVFVWTGPPSTWAQEAPLELTPPLAQDTARVLVSDDDTRLIVGETSSAGLASGSVSVYSGAESEWQYVEPITIVPPDLQPAVSFGRFLTIASDGLAVEAPGQGAGGVVYLFDGAPQSWPGEREEMTPPVEGTLRGPLAGSGACRILAVGQGDGVLAFVGSTYPWPATTPESIAQPDGAGEGFGSAVAVAQSGVQMLVGAPQHAGQGAAYAFSFGFETCAGPGGDPDATPTPAPTATPEATPTATAAAPTATPAPRRPLASALGLPSAANCRQRVRFRLARRVTVAGRSVAIRWATVRVEGRVLARRQRAGTRLTIRPRHRHFTVRLAVRIAGGAVLRAHRAYRRC